MNQIRNRFFQKEKREIIKHNWLLEPTKEIPFIVEIEPMHFATSKYYNDDQAELNWNINYCEQQKKIHDYWIPNIRLNKGIGIIASAFGCEYTLNENTDPWVRPLISEKNREDVYKLEVPDVKNNAIYMDLYKRIEYFQLNSNLPITLTRIPSPLVTASLIWDYTSFIEATVLFPKEVHTLLEKITVATIDFVKEQIERIKNLHSMGHEIWFIPKNIGLNIRDDLAVLMSPNLYREFGVRYNSQIAESFGGIIVHSCGDVKNVVETMMETAYLRGLELNLPNNTNWSILKNSVAGKTPLVLRYLQSDQGKISLTNNHTENYTKNIIDYFGGKGLFLHTSVLTFEEGKSLADNFHKFLIR